MTRKKKSLLVDIKDEDICYARKQDRFACAIVRAIQRAMPEALFVKADAKEIAFSLPVDDTRYYFETPPEVVKNIIEPFDKGKPIKERSFILQQAFAAEPISHASRDQRINLREKGRRQPARQQLRSTSKSGAVRTANRFLEYEAEEAEQQA